MLKSKPLFRMQASSRRDDSRAERSTTPTASATEALNSARHSASTGYSDRVGGGSLETTGGVFVTDLDRTGRVPWCWAPTEYDDDATASDTENAAREHGTIDRRVPLPSSLSRLGYPVLLPYAEGSRLVPSTGADENRIATPKRLLRRLLSIGTRPGEMDVLRWERVDVERRTITLDRSIRRADGGPRSTSARPRPATDATSR